MRLPSHLRSVLGLTLLSLTLAACGGSDDGDAAAEASDTAAAAPEAAASPAPAAAQEESAEASMTVEDIDRWDRGMDAELAAVREAGERLKAAKSGTDTLSAMMGANETSTRAAGASAAGVDESRYGLIRSTLSALVGVMAPLEADMDVKSMPAEMAATMRKSREESLARQSPAFKPEVLEALRPRAEALRRKELTLTGERLRAAGMAR